MVSRLLLIGLVIVIFFLLGLWGVSKFQAQQALKKQNQHLEKLEKYYTNEDFEGMYEYIQKHDIRGAHTYKKYTEVSWIYHSMSWHLESLRENREFAKQGTLQPEYLAFDLSMVFEDLYDLWTLEEQGFLYGEEDAVLKLREIIQKELKGTMLLTEEEIEEGFDLAKEEAEQEAYEKLAKISIKRME